MRILKKDRGNEAEEKNWENWWKNEETKWGNEETERKRDRENENWWLKYQEITEKMIRLKKGIKVRWTRTQRLRL